MLGVNTPRYGYPKSPMALALQYAREADERANRRAYARARIGQVPGQQGTHVLDLPMPTTTATGEEEESEARFVDRVREGVRAVTPTLLIVGLATGFIFAVGSALVAGFVSRYVWSDSEGRGDRGDDDGEG